MAATALTHDDIAQLPLRRFAQLGKLIEFAVPWAKKTLFLVGDSASIPALVRQGVSRGRIWTAAEVLELLQAGVTRDEAVRVAGTKIQFAGNVVAARPDAVSVPSPPKPAPRVQTQLALSMES